MAADCCYHLAHAALWLAFHGIWRLRVEGREHVPRQGGAILAPNHISNVDPPAVGAAAPRPVYFMAKEELYQMPLLGRILPRLHAFPVRRGTVDRAALRRAEELLRAGELVVIFPEGRESETGQLQAFQPGTALLALRAGVPVVPVWIEGTDGVMPYGTMLPRWSRRPVRVRFGPPLRLDDLAAAADRRQALADGTARIRAAVAALAEGE